MDHGSRAGRVERLFLALILSQGLHSIEEYVFRLYDVLAPARWVSGALGIDRAIGFVIANSLLVAFGLWCYFARVRPSHPAGRGWAWFWTILEGANGITHLALAAAAGGYFPGAATAPLLIATSGLLGASLYRTRGPEPVS
jgi:hypothetical protein